MQTQTEQRRFFYVKKTTLLAIAGVVWRIAGFNVARLGVLAYQSLSTIPFWYYLLSLLVFVPFGFMFRKMSAKHRDRIIGHQDELRPACTFFDLNAYLIMAVMMGGGIYLRAAHLVPDVFIAIFYTGLGIALTLAGVLFLRYFVRENRR